MVIRELTIKNKSGLHARPATLWIKAAGQFKSKIRLKKGEREVDGKSLLSVLTLELTTGSKIQLAVDGPDELAAADALEKLLAELES